MAFNHLQNNNQSGKILTIPFGLQPITGHLCWSKVFGASPNHQITAFNALGEGEFNACKGAFYQGVEIQPADYEFHPGALATGMTTGQIGTFFSSDVPHSRTATMGYKVPYGLGSDNTQSNPPTKFEAIFETKKCPDFNSAGVQSNFSYSTNPARQITELLKTYARLPNLPSIYASSAAYWLSRIDFGNWAEFRDVHEETETVDYTTLPDFKGFGLTTKFYNGTNFQTFVKKFIRPNIDIPSNSVSPAVGVTAAGFSVQCDGFIKAPATESRTFILNHDNGVRFYIVPSGQSFGSPLIDSWSDDGSSAAGTHSGAYALTAGQFYKVRIQWNNINTPYSLSFQWSSATQTQEIVPSKYLYPEVEIRKKWESHIWIDTPLSIGAGIKRILNQTNSIMQDVRGKLRFYCLDNLSPTFILDDSNIDSLKFRQPDILDSDPITELEAQFKDTDHQFLNEPATAVSLPLDNFANPSTENILVVNLFNTNRWQAKKLLDIKAKFDYQKRLLADIVSPTAKCYPVTSGDLITVQHRKLGVNPITMLVRKSVDKGISEKRGQGKEIEKRTFLVQNWS